MKMSHASNRRDKMSATSEATHTIALGYGHTVGVTPRHIGFDLECQSMPAHLASEYGGSLARSYGYAAGREIKGITHDCDDEVACKIEDADEVEEQLRDAGFEPRRIGLVYAVRGRDCDLIHEVTEIDDAE